MSSIEYPRVRKTLRRRQYQQSGGAVTFNFPVSQRCEMWRIHCEALRTDKSFNFILTNEGQQMTLEEYIKIVENQDKLFDYARQAIYHMLDINADASEEVIVNKFEENRSKTYGNVPHGELIKFIDDIEKLITGVSSGTITGPPLTRLKHLSQESKMLQLQMLVNPALFRNIFIYDLARICVVLKTNSQIREAKGDVKPLWGKRFNAVIEANSYALTSYHSLGGFYLLQNSADYRSIMGFAASPFFFNKVMEYYFTPPTEFTGNTLALKLSYLTSLVIAKISDDKTVKLADVLADVESKFNGGKTLSPSERKLNEIATGDKLSKIFQRITLEDYQFVIHLCAVINQLAPTEEAGSA